MTFKITICIVTQTGKIEHPDTQAWNYSSSDLEHFSRKSKCPDAASYWTAEGSTRQF